MRAHRARVDLVHLALEELLEPGVAVSEIEAPQVLDVAELPAADGVQLVLHPGRELVIDQPRQVPLQKPHDRDRHPRRHQRVPLLEHVLALLDRLQDRGVRAGPADAELLEGLDERRLGVARRGLGRVALHLEGETLERLTLADRRQERLLIRQLGVGIVASFDVRAQIPGEVDRLPAHLERRPAALDRDRHAPAARVRHLARHRALPDQLEEAELLRRELSLERLRQLERVAGRPDRLVGLLGVLDLRLVDPGLAGR